MTRTQHGWYCIHWIKAYYACLIEGRKLTLLSQRFGSPQLNLF